MLGLVPNSLAKWTHPDESFELVWLKKEFFDGNGNHLHWRTRSQGGHVIDVSGSQLSPIFPCVEEKEHEFHDKERMKEFTHATGEARRLTEENLSLRAELNKEAFDNGYKGSEIGSLRAQLAKAAEENAELKKENERWLSVEKARNDLSQAKREARGEESAPAIDWTKDVYLTERIGHTARTIFWRVRGEVVEYRGKGQKQFFYSTHTPKTIREQIEKREFVVIPNPWPEEEKPEVFIEEEDAKEISARGETVMPPGVSGSNVIEKRYRGVFVNREKSGWFKLSNSGQETEFWTGDIRGWEWYASTCTPLTSGVDSGELTLDPSLPWMKKEEKTWKVGDECEVKIGGKWNKRTICGSIKVNPGPTVYSLTDTFPLIENSCTVFSTTENIRPLGRSKKEIAQEAIELLRKAAFEKHIDARIADKLATEYAGAREE